MGTRKKGTHPRGSQDFAHQVETKRLKQTSVCVGKAGHHQAPGTTHRSSFDSFFPFGWCNQAIPEDLFFSSVCPFTSGIWFLRSYPGEVPE